MPFTKEPHLTERDRACLLWIAQQYAIRLDHLQRLLYRFTPEQDRHKRKPGIDHLSLDRTYEILKRWREAGLVEKASILEGEKTWVWLSRVGLHSFNLPFNYGNGRPSSIRLPHLYAINQVRLAIEAKRPHDLWKSERQILREMPARAKGEQQMHAPDALLTNASNGKLTAIEVEIHDKTAWELEDDLLELAATYTSVWYFTTRATRRQIEAKLDTFSEEMRKPFVLYDLKEDAQ